MLDGKTILVTGASKGIGQAIAREVAAQGARVVAHYGSDRAGAEQAMQGIPAERAILLQGDLGQAGGADAMFAQAVELTGGLDGFVNNAAMMEFAGGIDDPDDEWNDVWQRTFQVNVFAAAELLRAAVRHMRERGGGEIVGISSWAAQKGVGNPRTIAYAASKAAFKAALQTVATGYARDNIRTYIVAPGVVDTKMSRDFAESQGGRAVVEDRLVMGEFVPPSDIGALVSFCLSGRCRHLSGATLDVNGASYIR
ncbi:NAD(P)-dependent dehydrogenase, short-chain alcohol dehydrogenase family [Monaibacterium marinum]|uniref:NAD(P)-dependent dehydrogenase, short-chain alcohol dehydrogenase family n=1 Tax=Pontivivens marinum TaxID=1690039 RepID=A0A2C9CU48_9RHOB|nr:SDR family NAD(P)-dependent oxidoreductase [Monaibacterium marinum]SOH94886.1 NAD(P)-dependent dehydrogenase, short-chain alcohol dehydrogenase family [Monaibacterium marinum]